MDELQRVENELHYGQKLLDYLRLSSDHLPARSGTDRSPGFAVPRGALIRRFPPITTTWSAVV
jgi:hypothetical protein